MTENPTNRIFCIPINAIISRIGICVFLVGILFISTSCTSMQNNTDTSKTDTINNVYINTTDANLPSCDPGDANEWWNQTVRRRQELDNDFDQLNASSPDSYDDYVPYANRAKYRYTQQTSQPTPSCLSDVQDLVEEEAWLFWKMLDEASSGNGSKAQEYGASVVEITARVNRELALVIKQTLQKTNAVTANPTPDKNPIASPTQTTSINTPSQATPSFSEPPANPQMGNTWSRLADGMVMIFIPAGDFLMGSADSDIQAKSDEKPQHEVYLDAFWIDQTEVTNNMFAHFVQMTTYQTTAERAGSGWIYFPSTKKWQETPGADWRHPRGPSSTLNGRDEYPVVQVSWDDALAYCTWVGGRLPTEAEWEKAARGTDGRIYPWGNQQPDCSLANYWGMDNGCVGDTTAAGSYPAGASPYGLLDMAGNVLEWAQDWYSETYYTSLHSSNPTGPTSGQYRVLRGGAWDNAVESPRSAMRNRLNPDNRDIDFGFRCARTP